MFKFRNKKGFTIIELVVVIAIIGILVLFASPKVVNYVNQARLVRIQHDTRIMEDAMEEEFQHGIAQQWEDWDTNYKNLFNIVIRKQLFETEGVAERVDMSYMKYQPFIAANPEINPKVIASVVDGGLDKDQILADKINLNIALGGPEGVAERVDMSYMKYQPFITANPEINPKQVIAAVDGKLNQGEILLAGIDLEVEFNTLMSNQG